MSLKDSPVLLRAITFKYPWFCREPMHVGSVELSRDHFLVLKSIYKKLAHGGAGLESSIYKKPAYGGAETLTARGQVWRLA